MPCTMVMALPAVNSTNVSSVPHQDSVTSIELAPNPLSNSNGGGLAEALLENRERPPPFLKVIGDLQSLSNVIQTFHNRWDELQKLVDFIENAIQGREKQLVALLPSHPSKDSETNVAANETESTSLTVKDTTGSDLPGPQFQESEQTAPTPVSTGNSSESELESFCHTMSFRELRRYIVTHLAQPSKLLEEVPLALQCAPNPAELVLKCVGKFYLQAKKAFTKDSKMISSRQAALRILEYFLLMGCNNGTDESVKQEAQQAALTWRKRLITEGGYSMAGVDDAKGLLLLVGCFGIPDEFTVEDLIHLLRVSCARDISEAIRKSSFLLARVPEILECMGDKGMNIEALDIVYTFGIEDRFSQKTLAPFLKSLKEESKKAKSKANGSPFLLKEACQNQLNALKSLMKCLEAHKIDPAKVIPGWRLKEKITNLEKDIAEFDRKIVSKRKAEQHSSRVSNVQDFKRPKIVEESLAPMPAPVPVPVPVPSPFSSLQEPRVTNHLVYQLGSRYSDPVNSHPAAPWPHEYGATGISNRTTLLGASFGGSFSSGSRLPLPSRERSVERNFVGSTELGSRSYMGSSSLAEGYRVAPTFGGASRSSSSDLYHFADVIENDYARSPYNRGEATGLASYRLSYLK